MNRGATRNALDSRSLDPGDFSFHGFGELTRDEVRKILRLGIRTGDPSVESIENAIFVPEGLQASEDRSRFAVGILRPDGCPVEAALTHRKGGKRLSGEIAVDSIEAERTLDTEIIYLGLLFNHYGRVLLESLARAWYLKEVDPAVKVVFTNANSAQDGRAPWLTALLSEFGIPPERIWSSPAPVRLKRAIVPEPVFEQFYSAHTAMVAPFQELGVRYARTAHLSDQPLYLSRRRLSSRQRPVIGEVQLEEMLRENGFRIVYPETLSLAEQIQIINGHRDIVSPVGSAAHTILFAIQRPNLHLLTQRDDIPANYFLCSALAEAPTTFVNCMKSAGTGDCASGSNIERGDARAGARMRVDDPNAGLQARPQLVDFDATVAYLRDTGLVKTAPRMPSRDVRKRLDDQFDEAWAYARVRRATGKADPLPSTVEKAALERAARSWPVSLMLARYYVKSEEKERAEALAKQFIHLFEQESSVERLAYYRADIEGIVPRVARFCGPPLSARLKNAVAARWPDTTGPSRARASKA